MNTRLGANMNGGCGTAASQAARADNDFYRTPPEATVALLRHLRRDLPLTVILEPACGDGAICRVLERAGYGFQACDLVDRGFGRAGIDFLASPSSSIFDQVIITNPPFSLAEAFIVHALSNDARALILLLKMNFWSAGRRRALFEAWPPSMVLPLTWRLDFLGLGNPTMDCAWNVWGLRPRQFGDRPIFCPLPKPTAEEMTPYLVKAA